MVQDMSYNTTSLVIESWEALKRTKDYEKIAGATLFRHLFEKCPQAKVLFGFPLDIDTNSAELHDSKRFIMHSSYVIQMLDTALNMLGPDIELLTEIMTELGVKHVRYGVKPVMFPVMGEALIVTMKESLGDAFTEEIEAAWKEIYQALSRDMVQVQRNGN